MRAVLGCSMDLLASVAGTKKAKAHPFPFRRTRVGILSTKKKKKRIIYTVSFSIMMMFDLSSTFSRTSL
jgi:hypothetical protein